MKYISAFSILVLIPIAFTDIAFAEVGYSVSIGVDYSKSDTQYGSFTDAPPATITSDFSGVGGRIGFGVAVSNAIAFEGGWIRFGSDDATAFYGPVCPGGGCPPVLSSVKQDGSALWFAYTPKLDQKNWSLFGKFGLARTTIETKSRSLQVNTKNTDTNLLAGVGAVYYFRDDLGLRFDLDLISGTATTVGVGLNYRF